MPTLNYHQTLDMVEAFMIQSGIRAYCTDICKGRCCGNCYTSKNACHKHEGRRIACSVYMCHFSTIGRGKDFLEAFKTASSIVEYEAARSFDKYKSGYTNSYYHPPPKRMFKEFMILGWPPVYISNDKACVELVKTGLCLEYAAKMRVIMNKVIRLAQDLARSDLRPGQFFKQSPKLSQFEAKRIRRAGKLEWMVKHWETGTWV